MGFFDRVMNFGGTSDISQCHAITFASEVTASCGGGNNFSIKINKRKRTTENGLLLVWHI